MADFEPTITKVSEDARGEIYVIALPGDRELLLIHSTKGSLRGGHAHDVPEVVVLLTGQMKYHKRWGDGYWSEIGLTEGDTSHNLAGAYHMGEALADLWLIEWKIGTKKGAWKNLDYEPWREQVRAHSAR